MFDEHSRRVNDIIENVMVIGWRKIAIAETLSLKPWLEHFLAELMERKALAKNELNYQWMEDDLIVRMDASQLHQVLWNLAENALRYSAHTPALTLVCNRVGTFERPYVDVIDTGPGMSAKVAEQIFEPFYTGEASGTGLGLYIARELCESNQASLIIAAHGNGGCRFRINFAHPDRQQLTD
jgi:two-component system sensor histidine kinase PilS (NtrC family)